MEEFFRQRIVEMVQGNPGALNVLVGLMNAGHFGPIGIVDREGIRGSDIWLLYKDCNGQDIARTAAALEDGSWKQQLEGCLGSSFHVKPEGA